MNLNLNQQKNINQENLISKFAEELTQALKKFEAKNYIITDLDQVTGKLNLIEPITGEEKEVYCYNSILEANLVSKNKSPNRYNITLEDFKRLELGALVSIKNDNISFNKQRYDFESIKNDEVKAKVEDMFFAISDTLDSTYKVVEVTEERIFLTDVREGGKFSISPKLYPELKEGNLLKKENGKYTKLH